MILVRHGTERRFASDRSRQRARDDHCDTRGVARRASACQCRRERGEAPGAADREAQIYDRQAAPRQVRPIFRSGAPSWSNSSWRSRRWKKMPLRRKRRRRWQLQRPRLKCAASSGASRRAGRCLSICRASASSIPHPRFVRVAVGALHKIGEDVTETLEPHPTPVEGDPARAREVLLPLLQKHHPAAGVIASDLARGRAGPLLPARPKQQASRATSGQLCRPDAGRCVCRLQ
jgi:hypothetical protein